MFFEQLVPGGLLELIYYDNWNSKWKNLLGFRNLQEELEKEKKT